MSDKVLIDRELLKRAIQFVPYLGETWQALRAALTQDGVCVECGGTGKLDSGGTYPWGEPAMIRCPCTERPAALAAKGGVMDELLKVLRDLVALEADGKHADESAVEVWERARATLAADALDRLAETNRNLGLDYAEPLAQEAEPVAYRYRYPDGFWRFNNGERVNGCDPVESQAVHTAPPAAVPVPYGSIADRAAAGRDAGMWSAQPAVTDTMVTDTMVSEAVRAYVTHGKSVSKDMAAAMRAAIEAARAAEGE